MKKRVGKKAMSEVVSTLLMVVLVMVLVGVIWGVINNLVSKQMKSTERCFGNYDKISINEAYTCYNVTTKEFYFSINVGNIDLSSIFVAIGGAGTTSSIELNSTSTVMANVRNYPSNTSGVTAPGKNSGKTYIYSGLSKAPDYIKISPVIGSEKCQVTVVKVTPSYEGDLSLVGVKNIGRVLDGGSEIAVSEIKDIAKDFKGNVRFEYSPESFTGTELDYALNINRVQIYNGDFNEFAG